MSNCLTVSLVAYPFDKKSAEVAYIQRALATAIEEIAVKRGNTTSGTIIGISPAGVANTALGSWTYTPSATKP